MTVIFNQLITMAVVMVIGFVGAKSKYFEESLQDNISKIILRITMPLLVLTTLSGRTLEASMLKNALYMVAAEVVVMLTLFAIGKLSGSLFRMPEQVRSVHTCMMTFGNAGFVGYPLITALYGEEGLFYAVIFCLAHDMIFYSLGMFTMARSSGGTILEALKKLINPVAIAFLIGFMMLLFGLRLPELIHNTMAQVGAMTTSLSLVYVGMALAQIDFRAIYKRFGLYLIVLFKMILLPALAVLLLTKWGMNPMVLAILAIELSMPAQPSLGVFASQMGADPGYATEGIFLTTVLSMATLPALYWFILQIV